ncbi:MAG: nucleotide exchange factor GrpE [Thermodesulfovibrionales bacterium]|nr:nucleotide exchange factor GrpE [Thermodesulfovibrionales bacterium]MDP3111680.1 nucleotide exchange factor GrpE [Thermodesulfovibrionales bacterium]
MKKRKKEDFIKNETEKVTGIEDTENQDSAEAEAEKKDAAAEVLKGKNPDEELNDQKDKYLRLYAEFENYKKRVARDKEELVKYGNESLLYELLPVLDNLEMALKHASNDVNDVSAEYQPRMAGLVQGVEITLREFLKVIDKFGLTPIIAINRIFDPSLHHAMTQVERDDVDENTVVEEFRKGYMLRDKVLRPSLVAVSKKPVNSEQLSRPSESPPHSGGFAEENEATAVSEEKENIEENIEEEM